MEELLSYFEPEEIVELIKIDENIKEIDSNEVKNLISFLKKTHIKDETIKETIYRNPYLLERTDEELKELFKKLFSINIKDLDDLVMRNPEILSAEPFEIEDFLIAKRKEGYKIEDILDMIREGTVI